MALTEVKPETGSGSKVAMPSKSVTVPASLPKTQTPPPELIALMVSEDPNTLEQLIPVMTEPL
jgi:hypothetical protein